MAEQSRLIDSPEILTNLGPQALGIQSRIERLSSFKEFDWFVITIYQSDYCKETWKFLNEEADLETLLDLREMVDIMQDMEQARQKDKDAENAAQERLSRNKRF